ncbi:MAG: (d)CMP kinase [Planctomycetes bacterium]|nr:(d)CMP kinase [Planctomycetota bacterium]
MILAIDGPAGAGKSTVAKQLARELGLTFLDTGAMYRAVTWIALERGVDVHDEAACAAVARSMRIDFDDQGRVRVDGRPGEPRIRAEDVTAAVSHVAAHPAVRRVVVPMQREEARRRGGVVAEGRDVGSVVFPAADFKFYLDASPEVRAERRARELGRPDLYGEILLAMRERDRLDTTRADSPLVRADDAFLVDSDALDAAGVVRAMLLCVRARARA